MLDNTANQSSKFRIKNQVEINEDTLGTSNNNSQTKFKSRMLKSNLGYYSDAYILVKGIILVTNKAAEDDPNNGNTKVIFKYYAPFTDCISEINKN